jgi:hypothetical protein
MGGAIYQMWLAWRERNQLPAKGGWLDQPLPLLVKIDAIEMVYNTWKYKSTKGADWSKMSGLQMEIIRRLDNG